MKKNKIIRLRIGNRIVFFITLFLLIMASGTTMSQNPDSEKLDELFNYLAKNNKTMGSLTISKKGKIVYSKSIGYRFISAETQLRADQKTKYRIWSVTKMYTATMILQLIEERQIELSTPLVTFFPEIPLSKDITIEHMLSHKSGIHDFTQPDSDLPAAPEGDTQADMLKTITRFKPDFQPGDKFEYSNSNYLLLGYIIEKLDGVPYEKALFNRISSRIGLMDTYFGVGSLDTVENKSLSYKFDNNQWMEIPEGKFSGLVPGGAGSIVSTSSDMAKFIESLFAGRLITKNSLRKMTDIKDFYGLGIFMMPYNESLGYGHTGGYIASFASLAYYPQDSLAIAYCTNGQVDEMGNILSQVLAICYNKEYILPHKRHELELGEDWLRKYVGSYQAPEFILHINYEDTHLTAQPEPGRPKVTLFASKENLFFIKEMDCEIEFCSDETGKIDRLNIIQAGKKILARKVQ